MGCRSYGPLSDEALSRTSLMPSADIEVLGRAVWRLPESEIPEHPSRDWWCQQIIDHVAERAGELKRNHNDADHQRQEPWDEPATENRPQPGQPAPTHMAPQQSGDPQFRATAPPENGLQDLCIKEGNAAKIRPIQTTASEQGEYEDVSCPRCGADPGAGCQDLRSVRTGKHILNFRPHPERVQAAKTKDKLRRMRRSLFARTGRGCSAAR
jgi:hypothetical protein